MMFKKGNHYTLIFVPEDNGKTISFRINKLVIVGIGVFFSVLFLVTFILLFKSGEVAAKLQLVHALKVENEKLLKETKKLKETSIQIGAIETQLSYLEKLAIPKNLSKHAQHKEDLPKRLEVRSDSVDVIAYSNNSGNSDQTDVRTELASLPNISPVEGWITRGFANSDTGHQGTDFAAATGTPIRATAPGVVTSVANDKYLGLLVTIKHTADIITRYGHCSQVLISKGDRVKRGQTIALVGNTGRSTAPHLHYEIIKDGKSQDPSGFIIGHED